VPPFLNPLFLVGLVAAGLPILIHLFSRRRAKEVSFSSLEYLQEISRQKVRRMRLRQWLLLALRVLVIAIFALAMARPTLRGSAGVVTRGSSTVAIILDNSYSMAAADPRLTGDRPAAGGGSGSAVGRYDPASSSGGGADRPERSGGGASPVSADGTVFAIAKERAEEGLDLLGEGDRGILALSGRPTSIPFQTPVADAGLLRQEVRRAALSAGGSDLPGALAQLLPILEGARTMNRELFVISDFQRRDVEAWIRAASGDGAAPMGDTLGGPIRVPAGVIVYLIPVRDGSAENASIGSIRFEATDPTAAAGRLKVTVIHHGSESVRERVARASAALGNREILGDAVFDLPARGRGEASVGLASAPPEGAVEVRIGSDALEWDNTGWFVTEDPGARRVLVVTGGDPAEGRFLRTALDPEGTGEFFVVRETSADALALEEPEGDVVILSNVGRLSAGALEGLARFRARGGGILIGLGDRVDPRYYNTDVLGRLSSIELLNLAAEEGPGTFRSLRPTVLAHPIFAGFPIGPGDDLGSARFRKLVTSRSGQEARVLAEFGRAFPAIIEEDGLLLFSSSLDGQWNDFVLSASYPPLLHKMVRYLATRGGGDEREGIVGARLETVRPEGNVSGPVVCLDPLGTQSPVEATPADRAIRLRSEPTAWPGLYRFEDASGRTLARFAVNLDPGEGDLETASGDVLGRLFGREAKRLQPGQEISRELLSGRYGRELWRPLLVAVLLLMAVESMLGRGRMLG